MIREMVKIDEDLCNGCGACVPGCHEGALQIIDGKARLISEYMCDGLGACIGHCPEGAITIEKREAEPYDEVKVMETMVEKGANTVIAHMKHLKEHNEGDLLKQAVSYLQGHQDELSFNAQQVIAEVHLHGSAKPVAHACPGSKPASFAPIGIVDDSQGEAKSELQHWPVQMHLINPMAPYFQNADVVIAADCVAFSMGNFHQKILKGKSLAIACPKLDTGHESYVNKIRAMIDDAKVNTLTVVIMQVPCCGGLLQMVRMAASEASRKVPIKSIVISTQGETLKEEWV